MSTGTYGWRKTLGTEELHATAFAVAEFSFASEWDYNTSGGSWSEAHTGYAQLDLTEQADSYYDLSQTTTYDASGSPSFTGTKAYGRDVTSALIRDIEDWHDEAGSTGSDGGIYTWTSDSYEFGHSWSQNLETSAITTDSYNSVAGEIDWSHGQGLYGLPIGWEDYQFEYEMAAAPPGGGMSHIAGAHGLNPENLYLLDTPGTLPTSSHFVDANFEVPENVDYEAPLEEEGFDTTQEELSWVFELGSRVLGIVDSYLDARELAGNWLKNLGHEASMSFVEAGGWIDDQLGTNGQFMTAGGLLGGLADNVMGGLGSVVDIRGTIVGTVNQAIDDYLTYSNPEGVGGSVLTGLAGVLKLNRIAEAAVGVDIATSEELTADQRFDRGAEGFVAFTQICGFAAGAMKLFRCFPAGTPVHAEDGLRPIEDIRAGDMVWAYDLVASKWVLRSVVQTFQNVIDDEYAFVGVNGEVIESTFRHPYWVIEGEDLDDRPREEHLATVPKEATTPGRWVDAGDLRPGDVLLLREGKTARVDTVVTERKEQTIYNFAVFQLECYAVGAGGILVHNFNGIHMHHSDPVFMGGKILQKRTKMPFKKHQQLHSDLNDFLETRTNASGRSMRPKRGNPGRRIRREFTRADRLQAMADFYTKFASKYPTAMRDFFKQHPSLLPHDEL